MSCLENTRENFPVGWFLQETFMICPNDQPQILSTDIVR